MTHDTVITGARVVSASGTTHCDIGITDGKIVTLGNNLHGSDVIDAAGLIALPGGIDSHVHISHACLGLSFLIVFEIFARKLFNHSLQGVDEIGGYVVAITGTFGMALAAVERAHTRIDVLLLRLPSRVQAGFNLVSYVALGIGAAFMGYMGWRTLDDSLAFGSVSSSPLQVPLWIPQSLWMAGLVIFALSALWTALRGLLALRHGLANADRVLAPPTVAEEIEEARK